MINPDLLRDLPEPVETETPSRIDLIERENRELRAALEALIRGDTE